MSNRKDDTRLPLDVRIKIIAGDQTLQGTTRDISLTGLYAEVRRLIPLGTVCRIELSAEEGARELTIGGDFEVVRHATDVDPSGIGFRFLATVENDD